MTAPDTRTVADASAPGHAGPRRRHEGPAVGAIGATAVWAWLLISDALARAPFSTPAFLGRALLSVDAPGVRLPAAAGVAAFTVAHYAVWIAVCTLLMGAVRRARRAPSMLLGVALLLVLAQFLFVGITAILAQGRLGPAAWRDLVIGDAIGWGAVAWYVFRAHRELRGELARAGEG
jgi:hypothetical protein